jgi:hypothetical protein
MLLQLKLSMATSLQVTPRARRYLDPSEYALQRPRMRLSQTTRTAIAILGSPSSSKKQPPESWKSGSPVRAWFFCLSSQIVYRMRGTREGAALGRSKLSNFFGRHQCSGRAWKMSFVSWRVLKCSIYITDMRINHNMVYLCGFASSQIIYYRFT